MPRLLVFADSLSFHGPDGPCAADEPKLWPNITAAELGGRADIVAGIGWTARDAWWSLTGDPRVWADLHHVDAIVFAIGSMDTLPSPLPTYLRTGLRYLRPDGLRRVTRKAYLAAQPKLATVTRGHPSVLPAKLTVKYLDMSVEALRVLRPALPIVGFLPSVHRAESYGGVHTAHAKATRLMTEWAARVGVPMLDLPSVVGEHVLGGHGNADGMHWGWEGHASVGKATAALLAPLLVPDADGEAP